MRLNKEILGLLLDFRGKINHQQFIQGIVLISAMVVWNRFMFGLDMIPNIICGRSSVEELAILRAFGYFKIPHLPLRFMIFYSSVIISFKRFKEISSGKVFGMLLAILVFLFSHTIGFSTSENQVFVMFSELLDISSSQIIFYKVSFGIATFLGLAIVIFLSSSKKTPIERVNKANFDIQSYIKAIGNLLILFFSATGLVYMLSFFFDNGEVISLLMALVALIFIGLYLWLVIKRARDAGVNSLVIWGVIGMVLLGMIFNAILFIKVPNVLVVQVSGFIISFFMIVFELSNVMLLLLPSKN